MNEDKLQQLRISSEQKRRSGGPMWLILIGVGIVTGVVIFFAVPRASDSVRSGMKSGKGDEQGKGGTKSGSQSVPMTSTNIVNGRASSAGSSKVDGSVLTVSGYIVNRERIELSPRFMGVVTWIGVKKGDTVTNGQVVVLLDTSEYKARLRESEGRLEAVKIAVERAELDYKRAQTLVSSNIEMQKTEDDARLQLASARANVREVEGAVQLIQTYLDWCVIRSPLNGVVLEKLVDPNELVVPQSFGGDRGPSTALVAIADPKDLQVEVDLNEADVAKVSIGQKCRISPDAYPNKSYDGVVAEMAPEASRAKGTLQIKVQIQSPDKFLTPQLSAKVDFLK